LANPLALSEKKSGPRKNARQRHKIHFMNTDQTPPPPGVDGELVALFSQHRPRLERLVEFRLDSRLKRRIDPSDVLQEAYIELARRYPDYAAAPAVSFYTWARQITLQILIDVQRRHFGQKRSPEQEIRFEFPGADGTSASIVQVLSAHLTSPSGAAIRAEEVKQLHAALASMDETDREVLALRHFEHLGNNEVAEALGLTATAASNRYIRAMVRLGEIMQRIS
jgi:RNA polymerase sigma-70 factor, ECF subfamily